MKNKKYYPFERNNYFYGKLLTARDFHEEQKYINDKRRINNFLTSGAGIVSGLSPVLLDEKTISIETGFALDYMGREILVEESVTKKLSVIDGFENIHNTEEVYLCLEYNEKESEEVHSVTGSSGGSKTDYNRVSEGYHLFLTDFVDDTDLLTLNYLKEDEKVIYKANGIKITHIIPKYANGNSYVDMKVIIEKFNLPRMVEVDYTYNLTHLKNENDENKLRVFFKDEDITAYKKEVLNFRLFVDAIENANALIEIGKDDGRISAGTVSYAFEKNVLQTIEISNQNINERIIEKSFCRHFDDMLTIGAENSIYLAKMRLIKKGEEYSIESFERFPFRQFILSNNMLSMLMENTEVEKNVSVDFNIEEIVQRHINSKKVEEPIYYVHGTETIEIESRSKNKSFFSEEISHGLGVGDVMIKVAIEDLPAREAIFDFKKNIFGDPSVFANSQYEPVMPKFKLGVLSYSEKGSFRIGIKFENDCNVSSINAKWWASRIDSKNDSSAAEVNNVVIRIEPNTVSIGTREKCKLDAIVTGTNSKNCRWSVVDLDGGQIDINGIYQAPSKEGVYEVVAESIKHPNKKATAFIVVREK